MTSRPGLFALGLAALVLGGCSRGPRPAGEIAPPAVFAPVGDTSEVLSTIPEPPVRARTGAPQAPAEDNSPLVPSDTASDTSIPAAPPGAAPPEAVASPGPAPAPPADSAQALRALEAETWGVQLGAVSTRSAAFAEVQRAQRLLRLGDEEVTVTNLRGKWQFYVLAPRKNIQGLLERSRKLYPKGYLVRTPGRTGSW